MLNKVLQGRILVCEIPAEHVGNRRWIELQLKSPPEISPVSNRRISVPESSASFKLRISEFDADDIKNEFDPSYDQVGEYFFMNSVGDLSDYLNGLALDINNFIDSSDSDYPM